MSLHDIFDLIQDKLYRQLASPLSDCINRDPRALGSITEVEMVSFTDGKSSVSTNAQGLTLHTPMLSVSKINVDTFTNSNGSIDFNNVFLESANFDDPTASTHAVSKGYLDSEIIPINTSLNRINNYLLILSSTYNLKDQNGTSIKF
jgi:hypothetical protein